MTSPQSREYNCLAWAAADVDRRWDPDPPGDYFWPSEAPRRQTIDAFVLAYATLGYAPCESREVEPGFEKVALYAIGEKPLHAARQLSCGRWTSKLGDFEDIEHSLDALEGGEYGNVVQILKRPLPGSEAP